MKKLTLSTLILLAGCTAWAQQSVPSSTIPPLPKGTLLKHAPEFSQWIVTSSTPTAAASKGTLASVSDAAGSKVLKRVQVIKTGSTRYILDVESNGTRMETWCAGTKQVYLRPEWKHPMLADESDIKDPMSVDISKTDFPGCEWVSAKNYKGIQKLSGRDCIFFSDTVVITQEIVPGNSSKTSSYQYQASAYVDLETRLPVMLVTPTEVAVYQFGTAPNSPLTLPAPVKEVIDEQEKAVKQATSMPPRPF